VTFDAASSVFSFTIRIRGFQTTPTLRNAVESTWASGLCNRGCQHEQGDRGNWEARDWSHRSLRPPALYANMAHPLCLRSFRGGKPVLRLNGVMSVRDGEPPAPCHDPTTTPTPTPHIHRDPRASFPTLSSLGHLHGDLHCPSSIPLP